MALTKVSLSMIDDPVVDISTYGAVGDGVTDDWAALNSAINGIAAGSATQRVIKLHPQATYYISQPLIITNSVLIEGNYARIRYDYTGVGVQIGTTGTRVYKAHIKNLVIGVTSGQTFTTVNGVPYATQGTSLRIENAGNCTFDDVQIANAKYGIYVGNTYGVINYFNNLLIQNCEYGIYGSWGSPPNGLNVSSIANSTIFFCKRGVEILGGTGLTVDTVALQLCVERGAYFKNCGPLHLNNIYTESIGDNVPNSTAVSIEVESCGMVKLINSTITAIQDPLNHPKYCVDLKNCSFVNIENTYLSYGQDAHVHVDAECGRIELINCKGVVTGAGEQVRVIDDTIQGVVHSEVSQSAYPAIYFPSATSKVNYVVAPTDFTDPSWVLSTYTTVNALSDIGPSSGQVDKISFTSTSVSTSIRTTTSTVTGSGTNKIRLRFWLKLISIDTPVSKLGNFRIIVASTSPGAVVEEVIIPASKEWAFYDYVIDQFTLSDGTTANPVTVDQPFTVYIASELLGDAITVAVEGVQVSLASDFYYSGP